MGWLLVEGQVLASTEVARSRSHRARGLLGRDGADGAFVLPRTRWVHTIGMRFALDVAYVSAAGEVLKIVRMAPHRVGMPVPRARTVVEAEAGAFGRWGLHVGDVIELRE